MARSCKVKNPVDYGFLLSWGEKHLSLMSHFAGARKAEEASAEGIVGPVLALRPKALTGLRVRKALE
jgi:hypothetical protein